MSESLRFDWKNKDTWQFMLLIAVVASIPFGLTRTFIFGPILSILLVVFKSPSDYRAHVFREAWIPAALFFLYLLWAIPVFFDQKSFSFFEKTLPLLGFPLLIAANRIDRAKFVLVLWIFVYALLASYFLSLLQATYNYYNVPGQWGRQSDFFFHIQFTKGLFDIHPTYYSLMGCMATVFIFYATEKKVKYLVIFVITVFIFLVDARITVLLQLGIVALHMIQELFKQFRWKGVVVSVAAILVLLFLMKIAGTIYDYPHRRLSIDIGYVWKRSFDTDISDADGGVISRIAIWRNAVELIKKRPWLGVGYGNETPALVASYKSEYLAIHEYNAHSQLLSFLISFGVIGTSVILFYFGYLVKRSSEKRNSIYIEFLIVFIVCCFTESMLNRLMGVALFAFFNSFLFLKFTHEDE